MKSPVLRIITSPGIKKTRSSHHRLRRVVRRHWQSSNDRGLSRDDHSNLPVEVDALFDIRRQKCHLSYTHQRKLIHSTSRSSPMQKPEKVFLEAEACSRAVEAEFRPYLCPPWFLAENAFRRSVRALLRRSPESRLRWISRLG